MNYKLLITGIPGTGKTTVGNILEKQHGFKHVDLEGAPIEELYQNPEMFIDNLWKLKQNIVLTWGFVPESQTEMVLMFKEKGFKLFWFDGDREAARKAFNKRGDVPEELLDLQLGRIDSFGVVNKIKPTIYNTFDHAGNFKDIKTVIKEILHNRV
jgi:hypothetical protein